MTHVINKGMAMYWGTSRWTSMEIMEAYSVARQFNQIPPICEQTEYHMFQREKVEVQLPELFHKIAPSPPLNASLPPAADPQLQLLLLQPQLQPVLLQPQLLLLKPQLLLLKLHGQKLFLLPERQTSCLNHYRHNPCRTKPLFCNTPCSNKDDTMTALISSFRLLPTTAIL
ncbi:hypothetical protein NQZ68_041944 [Dissostichus eleginoides]|nr:hypothetical protein NQZ68_041944 [Dissostichus eleginoides]